MINEYSKGYVYYSDTDYISSDSSSEDDSNSDSEWLPSDDEY